MMWPRQERKAGWITGNLILDKENYEDIGGFEFDLNTG